MVAVVKQDFPHCPGIVAKAQSDGTKHRVVDGTGFILPTSTPAIQLIERKNWQVSIASK